MPASETGHRQQAILDKLKEGGFFMMDLLPKNYSYNSDYTPLYHAATLLQAKGLVKLTKDYRNGDKHKHLYISPGDGEAVPIKHMPEWAARLLKEQGKLSSQLEEVNKRLDYLAQITWQAHKQPAPELPLPENDYDLSINDDTLEAMSARIREICKAPE